MSCTIRRLLAMTLAAAIAAAAGTAAAAEPAQAPPKTVAPATVRPATPDSWDPVDNTAGGAHDLTSFIPRTSGELNWGVTYYAENHQIDTISAGSADVDWFVFKMTPEEFDNSAISYMVDAWTQTAGMYTVIEVYMVRDGAVWGSTAPTAIDTSEIDSLATLGAYASPWSYYKAQVVIQPHELIPTPTISDDYYFFIRVRPWINTATHTYDRGTSGPYRLRIKAGPVTRLYGSNRYDGAVKISRERWYTHAERSQIMTVTLASGLGFADALAGAGLAGSAGGTSAEDGAPLLLTAPGALPSGVAAEIKRVGASGVAVLGGTSSVSNDVIADLTTQIPGIRVQRVGGANRYEVAANVAREMKRNNGGSLVHRFAFIANGENFPDALAATPMAYANQVPILLTQADTVPNATKQAFDDCSITDVVVVGGTTSVSSAVETYLRGRFGDTHFYRIGGSNRWAMARDLAKWATDQSGPGSHSDGRAGTYADTTMLACLNYPNIGVASGENFPDALAAGPMCGISRAPLLLTPHDEFSPYIKAQEDPSIPPGGQYFDMTRGVFLRSYLFGGPASVDYFTFVTYDLNSGW